MDRNNNNRDPENTDSVENHADIRGNGNKTNQAGGHIIEGDYNQLRDEGRVTTDVFTVLSDILCSIGRVLFTTGIGDRLERLSVPAFTLVIAATLTYYGNMAYALFEPTGTVGRLAGTAAYVYDLVSDPLAGVLATSPAIIVVLVVITLTPIFYKAGKTSTTCEKCQRPFALMMRRIAYPSRASFDQEGNRHVPTDQEWFCIYCDGDAESDDTRPGEGAPEMMADGGGDNDAGVCSCSCHNED